MFCKLYKIFKQFGSALPCFSFLVDFSDIFSIFLTVLVQTEKLSCKHEYFVTITRYIHKYFVTKTRLFEIT
jgi:hypothetical protein